MAYIRLFVLIASVGSVRAHRPEAVKLVVGQPFQYAFEMSSRTFDLRDASGEELPAWLVWDAKERLLEGVPQHADIGKTFVRVTNDLGVDVLEISVSEEFKDPCGEGRSTFWVEIAFETFLSNLTIADQLYVVKTITEHFDINSAVLRVYSNKYMEGIRRAEVVQSGMQHEPNEDSATVMWKASCDEVDDEAIGILEKMISFDETDAFAKLNQKLVGWKLTKGTLLSRRERSHGVGTAVVSHLSGFATNEPYLHSRTALKTTTRSTRATKKTDKFPVRQNSLPAFTCKRGTLCEYSVPSETFLDEEDGDTRSLALSVFPIDAGKNWLTLDRHKQVLRGISLHRGDFEFRLEARDSSNQMTSAPFQVSVIDAPPTNHLFILDIQHSYERLTTDPDTLLAFTEKLANSLGDRFPKHVVIRNIEAVGSSRSRSVVSFSNGTLPHKFCQRKAIDAIKHIMLTRRRDRIRADFARSMDSRFQVRNARLELLGSCAEELPTSSVPAVLFLTTTSIPAEHDAVSFTYLWLPIALTALFICVLLTLLLVCCWLRRKRSKAVRSEYISKGLPVVFPEEIPQDDESATVSTPMLVKEERPPLIISQHENPLYKPPPPLFAASSPRSRNTVTNQRQPPPYIPP